MFRFFLLALFCLLSVNFKALALNNDVYYVENISAKSKAKSPSIARNLAVASARRDGFLILLTRLELNIAIADYITDEEISDMVSLEQVQNEKIAGNTYSANFNIKYAKNFVDHILKNKTKEQNSSNGEAPVVKDNSSLIIAGITEQKRLILWEEENQWRYALNRFLGKNSKKNFIVANPDIDNIASVNNDNITKLNFADIESMLTKYKSDSAYIMILNYDSIENKILLDVNYIRKMQKKQIRLSFVNVDRLDYEKLLDTVAQKAIEYLANSQLATDKNLNSNFIRLGIYLKDLDSWLTTKKKLENASFVSQINIESMSRDYAVLSVNFNDVNNKVEENFARLNLNAEKQNDNFYIITVN